VIGSAQLRINRNITTQLRKMKNKNVVALINEVLPIAKAAGDKIMEVYEDIENFNVETKDDNSPLTRADKEANKIICDGLEKLSVLYPIISEENKAQPYSERKSYEYCWMVDPLDGTKEFIKRNGEFTVNIALIYKNASVGGVVYAPVMNEMYYAVKGEGATMIKNGKSTSLAATYYNSKEKALSIVCSRSHLNDETQAFIDDYNEPLKVAKGSSLKFLILAAGEAQVYPRLAPTMEWDTAAAHIILEEAGGSIVKAENGKPLEYNKKDLLNPHFIAYGNKLDA